MEEKDLLSRNQLLLAVVKYPQIKERYVKKFERLVDSPCYKKWPTKLRMRIEKLLSEFAYEVTILTRDFDAGDKK